MTRLDRHVKRGEPAQHLRGHAIRLVLWTGAALLVACADTRTRSTHEADQGARHEVNLEQRLRDLQQAEALYLSGRYKEAERSFEQLTRAYPKNPEVWFRLGNTLMKQGQYDDAAVALQSAISLDPGNGRAALNLALCRLAQAEWAAQVAQTRFAPGTSERQQADAINRHLQSLLSDSQGAEAPR